MLLSMAEDRRDPREETEGRLRKLMLLLVVLRYPAAGMEGTWARSIMLSSMASCASEEEESSFIDRLSTD